MIVTAAVSLIAGVVCGHWLFPESVAGMFSPVADYALYILMFAVGISVGSNRQVFSRIKKFGIRILFIPAGIITGTVVSGFVCALLTRRPVGESLAIVCGLGWYSLSGVLVADLAGAEAGTVAFLSSLLRELSAFMLIPAVAHFFNCYTAIAPAAATSEDTTLPVLIRYTNEETVVMAVVNGILCSAAVPFLIPFFYAVF